MFLFVWLASIQKALMYSDTCCDTHVFALVQNFESRDFHLRRVLIQNLRKYLRGALASLVHLRGYFLKYLYQHGSLVEIV